MDAYPPFLWSFEVLDRDIDELGHASNIAYIRWIQDIAVRHSLAAGLDVAAYQKLGAIFVVVRQEVDYMRPVLSGEWLEAHTRIFNVMAAKCQRETIFVRMSDKRKVARSVTTWGFVDVLRGRPTRIPESVREAFWHLDESANRKENGESAVFNSGILNSGELNGVGA